MISLHVSELPQDVSRALAARAQRAGRTLEEQAIDDLRRVSVLEAAEMVRAPLPAARSARHAENLQGLADPADILREEQGG